MIRWRISCRRRCSGCRRDAWEYCLFGFLIRQTVIRRSRGSTFVAWLMGPMGNDVLARFVEVPALVFLFLAVVQLARALAGTPRGAGG